MFQQMQYFIAIVKNHSFTQAAVDCHISQSAISQQMKELENRLGVKLLDRRGRSFTVTVAGQYFYTHSQAILADVTQLVDQTVKMAQPDTVELRVGYLRSFGTTEFLQTVAQFSKEFPQVKVKITSGSHEDLYELLRTNQVELNFSDQRRALSNEYHNEFLTDSDFMVAVNQGLPVATDQIESKALTDLPCILIVDDHQQALTEEAYYREVLGVQGEFVQAKNYDDAQMLIAANQGYLITNRRTQSQLDHDIVRLIPLVKGGRQLRQQYYAYWKADNSGYYIESFAELLKQNFA
ncbi:LysR family transcriptional regulator [Levilactobacillus acidifarinae]|uniref:Transcription regulator n=1 Tax=Levilactobacillus acidifarinae DSM 19394 = JCM 15949 TaxID=1423715 RepID=A0A0R1LFU0_9LACO|nr:LysR family transcriptional regulator [Levilactobacillus acidifarinae]KRK94573.1 transcription regulator [Levilactobacillus acidifarinae DSM 19394]GEO68325.1 LysR family transcriptional regulator [Levilactobacillus acidifarinae]